MSATSFDKTLKQGQLGEGEIARWLRSKGYHVLPAYQVEIASGKGPRLFMADGCQLITPDLLCFGRGQIRWVEAKTKSAFTWHRLSQSWQTGIDWRHWQDYLRVRLVLGFPLWLIFLHLPGNIAKDTPAEMISPSGIYGEEISVLRDCIDHEYSGMVYWREDSLRKFR